MTDRPATNRLSVLNTLRMRRRLLLTTPFLLLIAHNTAIAQSRSRAKAVSVGVGLGLPVGDEVLGLAWRAGPSVVVGWERFIRTTSRDKIDISGGVLFERGVHGFDADGFTKGVRPSGDTATSASGPSASVTNVGLFGRFIGQRRVAPYGLFALGFFSSSRGRVTYATSSGSGVLDVVGKTGGYIGLALGTEIRFNRSAVTFEGAYALGASSKDEPAGSYVSCTTSSAAGTTCSTPTKKTQVLGLRIGFRQIVTLPRS